MREMEFLPVWYSELRRRRRVLGLQVWLVVAVSISLSVWLLLVDRNRRGAEQAMSLLQNQLVQTDSQIREMERLTLLEQQLQRQRDIQAKLGLHIGSARLLGELATQMPQSMSLLSLSYETEEVPRPLSAVERAALRDPAQVPVDRRLRVRLCGVAPTDVDVASFITELNRQPFLDRVTMVYAKDRRQQGYLMREFELSFWINLNMTGGS